MGDFSTALLCSVVLLGLLAISQAQPVRDRRNAIVVENGTHFIHDGDDLYIKEPSGKITHEKLSNTSSSHKRLPINYWYQSLSTFGAYTDFIANWQVPPTPPTNNGQTLMFFTTIEGATDILQPVLQFNNGPRGWTLASWYGVGSNYYESAAVPVNTGDIIQGIVVYSGGTWFIQGFVNGVQKNPPLRPILRRRVPILRPMGHGSL